MNQKYDREQMKTFLRNNPDMPAVEAARRLGCSSPLIYKLREDLNAKADRYLWEGVSNQLLRVPFKRFGEEFRSL